MSKIITFLDRVANTKYSDIPTRRHMGNSFEELMMGYLVEEGFEHLKSIEDLNLLTSDVTSRAPLVLDPYPFFVRDPLGSSRHPDFLIGDKGKLFYIECKTARTNYSPMWGSAFPHGDDIWIFCCGNRKVDETVFFLGKDVINDKQAESLKAVQTDRLMQDQALHRALKLEFGNIGIDLRPIKFSDCSKKAESPIFHPDKEKRKENVYKHVVETLGINNPVDTKGKIGYNIHRLLSIFR